VGDELRAIGGAKLASSLVPRLADAARAYEHDRYRDALTILRPLAAIAPESPSVRELYGLALYRLGRWKEALRELRAAHDLTSSFDQHPVMADCERALGRHHRVEALWTELRQAGVSSDLLAEGRLVEAGSLADRGDVPRAIALLVPSATRSVRRPESRHLRQWYALADLYERVGDMPRARDLFTMVVRSDPELSDAAERLAGLR
jgi:tetratricopeptide (TPR) repeat protein